MREALQNFNGINGAMRTSTAPGTTPTSRSSSAKPKGRSKGKGKAKGKGKEKEKPATKTKAKGKGKVKPPTKKQLAANRSSNNIANLNNIFGGNIFRDVETNTGFEANLNFQSTRKDEAMQELLASLPLERRETAKLDKAQILKASRGFTGTGTCRATANGQWLVNGMKSDLSHYQMLGVSFMRERETLEMEPRGGM